ncbi:MAG: DUF2066 domain-containing protein [Woeseiaceae bacterium]|nr:DUF2066 domain-containing protein [Woeseiaceae bacterium]
MKRRLLLALAGVFVFAAAQAVEVTSLYTAQVPLDDSEPDPRAAAYDTALAQVLLRVTSAELVNDVVLFDTLFPEPAAYVVQFRPGPDQTLFVTFDGRAIEDALRRAGQRVWGGDRPLTLVWLAVDWGGGNREIVAAAETDEGPDVSRSANQNRRLRERLVEVAERRGLPIAFPLMDGEDRRAVSFSDISGGFDERIVRASERYDVNSVLIGYLRASGGARYRWSYRFGSEQRSWSGEPEVVVTELADLLAREFAIGGDEPLRTVMLNVSGIVSLEDFGDLQQTLAGMAVIDKFAISEVAGDRIRYRVTAHGGAGRLARALRFEGLIEQERIEFEGFDSDAGAEDPGQPDVISADAGPAPDSLDFFYSR